MITRGKQNLDVPTPSFLVRLGERTHFDGRVTAWARVGMRSR